MDYYQHRDTLNNILISDKIAEVESEVNLSLYSGDFNAFKIEITTNVYDNNTNSQHSHEYYVPMLDWY